MRKPKRPRRISDTQLLMYLLSYLIADRLIRLQSESSSGSTKRKPRKARASRKRAR